MSVIIKTSKGHIYMGKVAGLNGALYFGGTVNSFLFSIITGLESPLLPLARRAPELEQPV